MRVHAPAVCAEGTGARTDTVEPRAGPEGLGKLLSSTSSRGVKILRQTLGVNCQMMSSTSAGCLRFPPALQTLPLYLQPSEVRGGVLLQQVRGGPILGLVVFYLA